MRSRKHIRLVNLLTDMLFARNFLDGRSVQSFDFASPQRRSVLTLSRDRPGGLAITPITKSPFRTGEANNVFAGFVWAICPQEVMSDNRYSVYRVKWRCFHAPPALCPRTKARLPKKKSRLQGSPPKPRRSKSRDASGPLTAPAVSIGQTLSSFSLSP